MDYNNQHHDAVQKIASLCYRLKTDKGIDAFFEFAPHVKLVNVRVFLDGWGLDNETCDIALRCYLDWDNTIDTLDQITDILRGYLEE